MVQRIPLGGKNGAGRFALVNDADAELVRRYNWYAKVSGNSIYACARVNGRLTRMHVLIMGRRGIDHKDTNGLNNQRSNLRPATRPQNGANARPRIGGSSSYKGVSWCRNRGKWQAHIRVAGRSRGLGYFTDEVAAAKAYDTAAREAWGDFSRTNFTSHDHSTGRMG